MSQSAQSIGQRGSLNDAAAPAEERDRDWVLSRVGRALGAQEAAALRATLFGLPLEQLLVMLEAASETPSPGFMATAYGHWIAANPASPQLAAAWFNLGVECARAGDFGRAGQSYRQALAIRPDFYPAAVNLGLSLEAQGQADAALAQWQAALQPDEARATLLNHRGRLLENLGRFEEAEQALYASLLTVPDQPDVVQHWSHIRQKACLWPVLPPGGLPGLDEAALMLRAGPLGALALTGDPALQRRIGAHWLSRKVPPAPRRLSPEHGYRHDRIRLGYVSSDFCRHAMSFLIVELLERHDRRDFEVFGYCSSVDDNSEIRARVVRALDHHVPALHLDDDALARRIRDDEIDVLIDLNGMTKGARLRTLRWRPAPVQMTYLGYVGPVPLPELDYLLCDDQVVPPDAAPLYAPAPLPLPRVYQANDGREPVLPAVSRADEELPDNRFVFCCFCNSYKITPEMFDAWMTILHRTGDSVLWLLDENPAARRNLVARAGARGIGAERLVFAGRVEPGRYLARMELADLFLDTSPYNAGTVASDALRMGLPLLTWSQDSFASRMAGSLLRAVGVTETVKNNLGDYIEAAVSIGNDVERHARLKRMLSGDAWRRGLGDSARFTAELEDVFRAARRHPGGVPEAETRPAA